MVAPAKLLVSHTIDVHIRHRKHMRSKRLTPQGTDCKLHNRIARRSICKGNPVDFYENQALSIPNKQKCKAIQYIWLAQVSI